MRRHLGPQVPWKLKIRFLGDFWTLKGSIDNMWNTRPAVTAFKFSGSMPSFYLSRRRKWQFIFFNVFTYKATPLIEKKAQRVSWERVCFEKALFLSKTPIAMHRRPRFTSKSPQLAIEACWHVGMFQKQSQMRHGSCHASTLRRSQLQMIKKHQPQAKIKLFEP